MTKDCICSAFYVLPKCFCSILIKYKVMISRSMLRILQAIKFLSKVFDNFYQESCRFNNSLAKKVFDIVQRLTHFSPTSRV